MCWPCCAEAPTPHRGAPVETASRRRFGAPTSSPLYCCSGLLAMEGVAPSGPGWATFWEVLVGLAMLSIIVAVVRLARGPTLADRVVALDLIATIAVVTAALSSIAYSQPVFLDLAVVLTLVTFVATVAFARAIQRTAQP